MSLLYGVDTLPFYNIGSRCVCKEPLFVFEALGEFLKAPSSYKWTEYGKNYSFSKNYSPKCEGFGDFFFCPLILFEKTLQGAVKWCKIKAMINKERVLL
jgi:hypothetical protein